MTINSVSQPSGVQSLVDVSSAGDGLKLGIRDRRPRSQGESVVIPVEALVSVLTEQPTRLQRIAGREGGTWTCVATRCG